MRPDHGPQRSPLGAQVVSRTQSAKSYISAMGLGLLPWDRLPAYVLGPLLSAFSVWLLWTSEDRSMSTWAWGLGTLFLGAFLVWYRYTTGHEFGADETSSKGDGKPDA